MPAYNKTFFCDGTVSKCYSLRTGGFAFNTVRQNCQQFGGDVVTYETLGEQIQVEYYFYQQTRE